MENQELLQYIKDAIEVETDLATQEQIVNRCCFDIGQRRPARNLESIPTAPTDKSESSVLGYLFIGIGAGLTLFYIITFGVLCGYFPWELIMPSGMMVIAGIVLISRAASKNAKVRKEQESYHQQVEQIQKRNDQKQREYDIASSLCDDSARAFAAAAKPHITATKEVLEKLYDKGVIYRKYCTLPALASIYEYFVTGRCTELTGPHGAYNLYEDELRKDTVISQLNTVIENMEKIRHNQYMLYQQVKSINETTNTIVSELQQIKGYTIQLTQLTALNAYYAALNERNTRVTMYYHL